MRTYADRWQKCIAEVHEMTSHMTTVMQRRIPPAGCPGGQHGLDEMLAKYLPHTPVGTYVDVGASHPIECSNTWNYYQHGWRGLLIEPYPQCWYGLMRLRPGDALEPIGAMDYDGVNMLRISGTVSSFNFDWDIKEQANVPIEVERLSKILSRHPDIRDNCKLCSIDTEGTETNVLDGIDFNTFHPDVFVIEYSVYNTGEDVSANFLARLAPHGYRDVDRTELNVIYKRQ